MSAVPQPYFTVQEYLALEEASENKHEYYQGVIYAMAGASERHNRMVVNIIATLHAQMRGKGCAVYPSDLRIKIEETGLYTYPDVSVVCPPIRFDGARRDTVLNPSVLVEVLSPSSNYYDRGKKFQHYRTIESLTAYLLVSQDTQCVELYERLPNDRWLISNYHSPEQQIPLPGIDCVMPLAAIYEGVDFMEPLQE